MKETYGYAITVFKDGDLVELIGPFAWEEFADRHARETYGPEPIDGSTGWGIMKIEIPW